MLHSEYSYSSSLLFPPQDGMLRCHGITIHSSTQNLNLTEWNNTDIQHLERNVCELNNEPFKHCFWPAGWEAFVFQTSWFILVIFIYTYNRNNCLFLWPVCRPALFWHDWQYWRMSSTSINSIQQGPARSWLSPRQVQSLVWENVFAPLYCKYTMCWWLKTSLLQIKQGLSC